MEHVLRIYFFPARTHLVRIEYNHKSCEFSGRHIFRNAFRRSNNEYLYSVLSLNKCKRNYIHTTRKPAALRAIALIM